MESLYVCHFSNGHIKVGRSINPEARIADHIDRVSCVGLELTEWRVFDCNGPAQPRESALIERCAQAASKRFKSEWFAGLSFDEVCKWAEEAATTEPPSPITTWTLLIEQLRRSGWSQAALAAHCGVGAATMSRLALGQQSEPMYSVGEKLLALQAELGFA
jgi:hypothetical protein